MSAKPLHVYQIEDGVTYWWVAPTQRAAYQAYVKSQYGTTVTKYRAETAESEQVVISACEWYKMFSITNLAEHTGAELDETREMTFAEWAREAGPGMLATDEA